MWSTLIVEDEHQAAEYVRTLVLKADAGFRIVGDASNGKEAYELIVKNAPDLVICDIRMPEWDGIELLKRVRQAGIESRFVMLTCMNEFEYARQALEYGASSYLLKLSMDLISFKKMLEKMDAELRKLGRMKQIETYLSAVPERDQAATDHPEINKVIEYLNARYRGQVTLSSAARHINMDPSYLSDLFKRKTSLTLTEYVNRLRIDAALFYLKQTDDAVGEIGARVGFMNDNYFIKMFKRLTGMTPSQYRRQFRP
ncbi:response regulator [Paenibacillus beijingensis]|uniref:AraC family transcriptional regulator n=1 Tax=Paenibacillus beijingensis TaxID=1126833 RepID=A0A0D5NMK3_9BACL|nr:response regulator [Paenibacillus beijingensis]AJY76511.1 hypothetical protein VN24_20510 [Paenibacillus beijingensis]